MIKILNYDVRDKTFTITERQQTQEELNQIVLEENKQKVLNLKQQLKNTDYQAIKYAEGAITAEDYAETKAQRQAWRDEINELQIN